MVSYHLYLIYPTCKATLLSQNISKDITNMRQFHPQKERKGRQRASLPMRLHFLILQLSIIIFPSPEICCRRGRRNYSQEVSQISVNPSQNPSSSPPTPTISTLRYEKSDCHAYIPYILSVYGKWQFRHSLTCC